LGIPLATDGFKTMNEKYLTVDRDIEDKHNSKRIFKENISR
jgi:hypothetical protein